MENIKKKTFVELKFRKVPAFWKNYSSLTQLLDHEILDAFLNFCEYSLVQPKKAGLLHQALEDLLNLRE